MGTHMDKDLRRPRTELVLITEKLPEDKALEEGEEYEYNTPHRICRTPTSFHPKKEYVPTAVVPD